MKNIKIYEAYRKISIEELCKKYSIVNYEINEDKTINVDGDVYFNPNPKWYYKIPIKFNKVYGNFSCDSRNLKSLKNSPRYISKNFTCINNHLTTLLNGPTYVGLTYNCIRNYLKDFYGFPENFFGRIFIYNNPVCEITNMVEDDGMQKVIRFIKLLNEYKVIRNRGEDGKNIIIQDRLEEALYALDIKSLKKTEFHWYNLI